MNNSRTFPRSSQTYRSNARSADGGSIRLASGECWAPRAAQPTTLRCTEGSFWWTRQGDARDHLLRAGEQLMFSPRESVVLQALTRGELVVERS